MKILNSWWYGAGARLLFGFFWALTSVYAMLAYIPFTYHQVILSPLLAWQEAFARFHPLFALLIMGVIASALLTELRDLRLRIPAYAFLGSLGVVFLLLLAIRPISHLRQSPVSLLVAWLAFLPIVFLVAFDMLAGWRILLTPSSSPRNDSRIFIAAIVSGFAVFGFYQVLHLVRAAKPADRASLGGGILSLLAHLVIFMILYLVLSLTQQLGELLSRKIVADFLLTAAVVTALLALVFLKVVFASIAFSGPVAAAYAIALGAAVTLILLSASLRSTARGDIGESGLDLMLAAFPAAGKSTPGVRVGSVLGVIIIAAFIASRAAVVDWDYLLQKLAAVAISILTYATAYTVIRGWKKERQLLSLGCALLVLAAYVMSWRETQLIAGTQSPSGIQKIVEGEVRMNPSFRLLRGALTPAPPEDEMTFFRFLQRSTNIGREIKVRPVESNFGPRTTDPGMRPHIFIFVFDSLRRDYVSPYNRAVTFTPSLDEFAKKSIVFRNAFTAYGGTGLSEPSIWAGSLLLHKHYVTPFYPMNALQKLLEAERYQAFVSVDPILEVILKPSPNITPIDTGGKNYDLCRSIEDLKSKIATAQPGQPLFSYVQPQNIHIAAIGREGNSVLGGEHYAGFHDPYASRLRRMDECFGDFIDFLKKSNLYDSSIVVVTSDHGDSLGEEGRWGHAYTVFPEVLSIPLIIHLPASWDQRYVAPPQKTVFLTDITPTLYYLLGYRDQPPSELAGRPIVYERGDERFNAGGRPHLVASSYGAVYGLLSIDGSSLYIADALNVVDYLYRIDTDGKAKQVTVRTGVRKEYRDWIRARVDAINRHYGLSVRSSPN